MNKKTRGVLIGAFSGAVLGSLLAWAILTEEQARSSQGLGAGKHPKAGSRDWLKLGMSILQAGRNMADVARRA